MKKERQQENLRNRERKNKELDKGTTTERQTETRKIEQRQGERKN